jgi:hypothetical protein
MKDIREQTKRKQKKHEFHGLTKSKLYTKWKAMRQRTNNSNDEAYRFYGAWGIKLCDEWNQFSNFYKWAINNGYTDGLTIDRIDSFKDYEPSNCRWVTLSENFKNKKYRSENHGLWFHQNRIYIRLCRNHKFYYNGSTTDINEARKLRDEFKLKIDELAKTNH